MHYLPLLLLLPVVWFSFRYAWWARPVSYCRPRILMYHMISEPLAGARFNGLRVAPAMFDRQLGWLSANGWTFMTLGELVNCIHVPERTVVITFDDGFADNCTNALPILKKYSAKATLFLVEERHANDWSTKKKAHHDSGELAREPKLDDRQVHEMLDSGLVELGAHTFSHANLQTLEQAEREREVVHIRQHLEQRFGTPVSSFAYPFGIYEQTDVQLVRSAGYSAAVTTEAGIDADYRARLLELKRIKISGKDNFLAFRLRIRRGRRGWLK